MSPTPADVSRPPPPRWRAGVLAGLLAAVVAAERVRPLRPVREARWRRDGRNLAVAALAGLAVQALERPAAEAAARWAARRGWGLERLPGPAGDVLAVLWLDYGLYLWHGLLHRAPLWRLHRAHHADLEVSASTALRLHVAEMALSAPWRAAQVATAGVGAGRLALWRDLTLLAVVFHHANLRLPTGLERVLSWGLVTPRMHGIHHSVAPEEAGANRGALLSVWDRLHGTLRLDQPQPAALGLADKRSPRQVTLARVLAMPLERRVRSC